MTTTWDEIKQSIVATEDTLLVKIAALLRKAESTTDAEAEALIAKAQQLSTMASIDIEMARRFVPAHERREAPIQKHIPIGPRGKMGLSTFCELFMAIGKVNDLKFLIAHNSTYVIAFGFPSDIETTEALYASIVVQMVQASDAYLRKGEYKNEKVWREFRNSWGDKDWGYKPVSGRTARIAFQEAYAYRIGARLREARAKAVAARETAERAAHRPVAALPEAPEEPVSETSVTLVLRAKTKEVEEFYQNRPGKKSRASWKGGSSRGSSSHASGAGRSAADSARLGAYRRLAS